MSDLRLTREAAYAIQSPVGIEDLSWASIHEMFAAGPGALEFAPEGYTGIDPRSGEPTIFNEKRASRPHDYAADDKGNHSAASGAECVICAGETTPILDAAELTDGFSFINTNLYPVVAPAPGAPASGAPASDAVDRHPAPYEPAYGVHFLQWTSSVHTVDWPELSVDDRGIVVDRLAALEKQLLSMEGVAGQPDERHVSIIKNVGRSVGGSLSHGHQQIALSNLCPRRIREDRAFLERTGRTFSSHMLARNPDELTVFELQHGRMIVPYFMRRPFDMQFVLADPGPQYLYELDRDRRLDVGTALARGMRLLASVMHRLDLEIAYNVVFHTGAGGGIYLEFLPFTQAYGGFEQLGLSACQGSPPTAAQILRESR